MATMNLDSVRDVLVRFAPNYFADATNKDAYLYNRITHADPSDAVGPRWFVKDSGVTARGFAEGATFGNPQKFTQKEARLDPGYFETTLELTGRTRDALAKQGDQRIENWFLEQLREHINALVARVEAAIKGGIDAEGSGFVGLLEAIADSNTYAGIDRSVVGRFAAPVINVAGPITMDAMETLDAALRINNRGMYNEIWMGSDVLRDYLDLASEARRPEPRLVVNNGARTYEQVTGIGDANVLTPATKYRGVDIYEIPGYAAQRVDFVQNTVENLRLEIYRDIEIGERKRVNDDDTWAITYAAQLVNRNPYKKSGALTGVTSA